MTYQDIIKNAEPEFKAAVEKFKTELKIIRTGRAHTSLVENIKVDYYGTKTPLIQLASISAPDAKQIVIQPWDKNSLKKIEEAISASSLGLAPIDDGLVIRLNIPALTEERRHEILKVVNEKTEEARVALRKIREGIWQTLKDQEKEGKISEDDKFRGKDELEKKVESYNKEVEKIREEKEKEVMTV